MELREKTKKEVLQVLEKSQLGENAFQVQFPDINSGTLKIFYAGNSSYYFTVSEYSQKFTITNSPGIHLMYEANETVTSFPDVLRHIGYWIDRVVQDLKDRSPLLNKLYSEINRIEEEFEQKIDDKFEDSTTYFSSDEIIAMNDKIDSLYTKFEELKTESSIKDNELRQIKSELDKIKSNLNFLPKKTWYKTGGKKIISLIGKYLNPETIRAIAVEATKALLENNK